MKKLSTILEEQLILQELENERLLSASSLVNRDYDILKSFKNKFKYQILNESNALYKGQFELSEFLGFEIIKKHSSNCTISFNSDELTKFENIFFDKVIVEYKPLKHEGGYKGNKNDIDENNLKKYVIKISINSENNKKFETIFSTIAHELKHAWQDYKTDFGKNSPNIISNSYNYKEIIKNLSGKPITTELAANYLYHSFKIEKDAFASEFATELKIELEKKKPKDINGCVKLSKNINIFNELSIYREIFLSLDIHGKYDVINKENEIVMTITKNDVLKELNKIINKNYNWQQIKNKFIIKLEKSFYKLCNIIANMYFEYSEKESEVSLEEITIIKKIKNKYD